MEVKELISIAIKLGKLDLDQKQYVMGWLDAKLDEKENNK